MKAGSALADVVQRVDQQARSARDFIAHSRHIRLAFHEAQPRLVLDDGSGARPFDLSEHVHDQIASALAIPAVYYQKMRTEHPELMATNVNAWLSRSGQRRLLRTTTADGPPQVRALLSDRYRPLDHGQLLEAVLPVLRERNAKMVSTELTPRRLYLKALNERLVGEVKPGQVVMAGIAISNSEIGCGALTVQPLIYTLACTNGMIVEDLAMRRHHVGKRLGGEGSDIEHLLSDETRQADDRAFYLRVRDCARGALDDAVFRQQVSRLQAAAGRIIPEAQLGTVVEVTAKRFNLTPTEGSSILAHLRAGGEFSQWGLCSAITRHSQDIEDYDRATDLERIGGQVIELSVGGWSTIASAN